MPGIARYLDAELVERLDRLRPSVRRNVDGISPGLHRSLLKGASLSFRQHRAYVRGDDPRRLDWRVLARTDRLFIREYDHDTNLQCVIAVDASGSMAYGSPRVPAKFSCAGSLATALAYLLLRGGEGVGLAMLDRAGGDFLPPSVGPTQLSQFVETLDRTPFAGPGDLAAALDRLGRRLKHRSLLVVLSDFFTPPGPLGAALARLARAGHETICAQILHPDEIDFPFRTFTRLQNLESGHSHVVEPAAMRAEYLGRFGAHTQDLRRAVGAGRATLLTARTDSPTIAVIEQLLHRPFTVPS